MSLSDFSLFLPGSTNNKNTPGSKNIIYKNQVKIDIQKIQTNFKKLIDTIISLINDKKRLESELSHLKTNSQKQKNISSTSKNSQELLKYIGILDNYLIEVNKTLKDHPNEKSEILSEIQQRINQNFGAIPKKANNSGSFSVSENINFGVTPKKANNSGALSISENINLGVTPKRRNNSDSLSISENFGIISKKENNSGAIPKKANNSGSFLKNKNFESLSGQTIQLKINKFASTLEELMGVNYEPNNNTNANSSSQESLFLNNRKANANSSSQESLFLNNRKANANSSSQESLFLNTREKEENSGRNTSRAENNVSSVLGNFGNGNRNSRAEGNVSGVLGNFGNSSRNSGRAENNVSGVLGNFGNGNRNSRAESNVSSVLGNFGNGSSNSGKISNNSANNTKSLTNFLGENNRNSRGNSRVVEEFEEDEEQKEEQQPAVPQNSNKSIFASIGESLGLTTPTTPQNNSNTVQTNMKKAKCEGEDCDIFSEDVKTSELNTVNLGKNFTNGENRYNNARKKILKLLGEQVTTSRANNQGKISSFPREGDITTYLEET